MSQSTPHLVRVAQSKGQAPASRAHTQFNNLIKKIDKQKQELAAWVQTESIYRNKVAKDYLPLREKNADLREELVRLLDRAHDDPLFKKRDRAKLGHLILSLVGELLVEHQRDDLKPLYDKYNEVDFDTEQAAFKDQSNQMLRSLLEGQFGMTLDEDLDLSSPEQVAAAFKAKLREDESVMEERQRKAEARRAKRPKTAKQLEREAREEAEQKSISQSIQAIYRKLVTELHPDREPDADERARKTELMQAVNVAYEKRDLLQLLELQLTLEQIEPDHLGSLTEERIKHYNKILREQSSRLDEELYAIAGRFRMQFRLSPYLKLTPQDVIKHLNRDIASLRSETADLQRDIEEWSDWSRLKTWLKDYRIPKRPNPEDLLLHLGGPIRF
jgi:hypothetical protein